jgi:hypothetical protein
MRSIVIALCLVASSCSWFYSHGEPVIVDCVVENQDQLATLYQKLKADVPDWGKVKSDAIAAIPTYGHKLAGCVIAQLVQQYMTTDKAPPADGTSARDVLEDFRAKHAGGATFRTAGGDL